MKIDQSWPWLSTEEAKRLAEEGKANVSPSKASKSVKQIWLSNLFTFYNMLNIVLAVLVITTGSYRNMMFLGIVITNFFIGTIPSYRLNTKLLNNYSIVPDCVQGNSDVPDYFLL